MSEMKGARVQSSCREWRETLHANMVDDDDEENESDFDCADLLADDNNAKACKSDKIWCASAAAAKDDDSARRVSGTSSEFKRGIFDQLSKGKVPPVRERLLKPAASSSCGAAAGRGSNLGAFADSVDNLASLIPR